MSGKRRTLIIAEAGVNHNGDISIARQLVDTAADAGADIVKFQTFRADALAVDSAPKAAYQSRNGGQAGESQADMLRKLEMTPSMHEELQQYCVLRGIEFLSTPFDLESVSLLASMNIRLFKIPSGEITNLPYLRAVGGQGREILLSTGMSNMEEIAAALAVLEQAGTPQGMVTLLHCTTEYPAPVAEVNLLAIGHMREAFPAVKGVGYSDHTKGIEIPIAAVALGATVIEKHFTISRNLPGPDHKASLEPDELQALCAAVRNIEQSLGDGRKRAMPGELANRAIARKSIVAARDIAKGELFTPENLTAKRPATGVSPMRWDAIVGTSASRSYKKDDLLCEE